MKRLLLAGLLACSLGVWATVPQPLTNYTTGIQPSRTNPPYWSFTPLDSEPSPTLPTIIYLSGTGWRKYTPGEGWSDLAGDLSYYVPYTGATSDVDLGDHAIGVHSTDKTWWFRAGGFGSFQINAIWPNGKGGDHNASLQFTGDGALQSTVDGMTRWAFNSDGYFTNYGNSPTATGDLWVGSASWGAMAPFPIGTDGYILKVDTAQDQKLSWFNLFGTANAWTQAQRATDWYTSTGGADYSRLHYGGVRMSRDAGLLWTNDAYSCDATAVLGLSRLTGPGGATGAAFTDGGGTPAPTVPWAAGYRVCTSFSGYAPAFYDAFVRLAKNGKITWSDTDYTYWSAVADEVGLEWSASHTLKVTDGGAGRGRIDAGGADFYGYIYSTGNNEWIGGQTIYGNAVFNENGTAGVTFRVEGDADANLIYADTLNDRIGIGTATPTVKHDVAGDHRAYHNSQSKRYHASDPRPYGWPQTAAHSDDQEYEGESLASWSWHTAGPSTVNQTQYPGYLFLTNNGSAFAGDYYTKALGTSLSGDFDLLMICSLPSGDTGSTLALVFLDGVGTGYIAGVTINAIGSSRGGVIKGTVTTWGAPTASLVYFDYTFGPEILIHVNRTSGVIRESYSWDGRNWFYYGAYTDGSTFTTLGIWYTQVVLAAIPWDQGSGSATVDCIRIK